MKAETKKASSEWVSGKVNAGSIGKAKLDALFKFTDLFLECSICIRKILNGLTGVNDRTMVSSSKLLTNGFE